MYRESHVALQFMDIPPDLDIHIMSTPSCMGLAEDGGTNPEVHTQTISSGKAPIEVKRNFT